MLPEQACLFILQTCVCWGYRGGDVRVLKVQRSGCVCIVGNMYTCMHQGHVYIGGTKGIDIARFPSQFTDQDSLTT